MGMIASTIPLDVSIPLVFKETRALAMGMSMFGLMIGLAIGPFICEALLEEYALRGTIILQAGILLQRVPLSLAIWCPQDKHKGQGQTRVPACKDMFNFGLLKNKYFMLYCIASGLGRFYFTPFSAHLPSFAVALGASLKDAAWLPTVTFIACAAVSLLITFISNFISPTHRVFIFVVAGLLGTLSVVILLLEPGYIGGLVASALGGMYNGQSAYFLRI